MSAPDTASPSPAEGRVHFTRAGAIAHLAFDRPTARNAMSWRMYEEMA
ncbi:MAG: enoyl-CoA hydratase, partial [Starkeya sp.]|nr:enoyl-CoA hydratase [Starkeya sp.]